MPFAELGQRRIWYEINGQGEPLVQLPGGALGLRNFSRVTPVLARRIVKHRLVKVRDCIKGVRRQTGGQGPRYDTAACRDF